MTRFSYARWRLALLTLVFLALGAFGATAIAMNPSGNLLAGGLIVVMAGIAVLQTLGRMFSGKPAVGVAAEGLTAQRLGGKLIPWEEMDTVRLRWTKRRAFLVVPLNTPELVLVIHPDKPYWRQGGLGRAALRLLSRVSDNHDVMVNLNGLMGGKPERVIDAIRAVRPELVQAGETITEKAE